MPSESIDVLRWDFDPSDPGELSVQEGGDFVFYVDYAAANEQLAEQAQEIERLKKVERAAEFNSEFVEDLMAEVQRRVGAPICKKCNKHCVPGGFANIVRAYDQATRERDEARARLEQVEKDKERLARWCDENSDLCQARLAERDALKVKLEQAREAWDMVRDAVLNERYGLAEQGAGSDVINAVLGILDDYMPTFLASTEPAKDA